MTTYRFTDSFGPSFLMATRVLVALAVVGCMGIVFVAIGWPEANRILNSSWIQWMGRVSFGLYLIHVPLLVTLAYAFGWENRGWALFIGIPASLVSAHFFTRWVEQPTHRLARRFGSWTVGLRKAGPSTN